MDDGLIDVNKQRFFSVVCFLSWKIDTSFLKVCERGRLNFIVVSEYLQRHGEMVKGSFVSAFQSCDQMGEVIGFDIGVAAKIYLAGVDDQFAETAADGGAIFVLDGCFVELQRFFLSFFVAFFFSDDVGVGIELFLGFIDLLFEF